MVADRAGRQFGAVADDVVLDRLEVKQRILVVRIERQKLLRLHVRHRERVWEKSIFFSSSFHSYIGKSTIQQNSKRPSAISFSSWPSLVRARPANFQNLSGSPATKNAASPSFSPSAKRIAAVRSGPMLLASGPAPSPPSRRMMCPSPGC